MTPADRAKLARMIAVATALKDAARTAWEKGGLRAAAGLYARADVAETRAHYFELEAILREDVEGLKKLERLIPDIDVSELFRSGRPML